jgi:PAS domain S-box-containing protein
MPDGTGDIAAAIASWWRSGAPDLGALRAAIEVMPVGVLVVEAPPDRPLQLLAWNPAYLELLGWVPSVGGTVLDGRIFRPDRKTLVLPDELPGPIAARTGAAVRDWVEHFYHPDGTWRVLSLNAAPLPDRDGVRAYRAVVTFLDLTARYELEALRDRTAVLGAHVRDAIFLVRPRDGQILDVNAAAEATYRRTRDQLVAMRVHDLRAAPDEDATDRVNEIAGREGIEFEVEHRRGDGSTFFAEVSVRAAEVDGARVHIATSRDVTRRVAALSALRAREALFRAVVENQSDVIFMMNAGGVVTYVSPSVRSVAGFSPEELVGTRGLEFVHPQDRARAQAQLEEILARGGPGAPVLLRSRHADGSYRHVEVSVRDLRHLPGVEALLLTSRDVTERVELEARARNARRALVTLGRCNEALVRATAERELLEAVCRIIVEDGGYRMCWVGMKEADPERIVRPVAAAGEVEGDLPAMEVPWREDHPGGRSPTGVAARTGHPVVSHRFEVDPASLGWWEALRFQGLRGCCAMPLATDGRTFGVLTIYAAEPGAFQHDELELLRQLAEDVGYGVGALRARAERAAAEERLRRSREELRALAARIDSVREEEKARIARDLHDDMGQILTGLRVDLDHLEEGLAELPQDAVTGALVDRAVDASALVGRAVAAMRHALSVLRPSALDRLGLVAALRQEGRDFQERTGIRCALELPDSAGIPADAETALFRIAQEALTNVARHARARAVRLSLASDDAGVTLEVADDGQGLVGGAGPDRGLGIVGMRERAERLGGSLSVASGASGGTTVSARVPSAVLGGRVFP